MLEMQCFMQGQSSTCRLQYRCRRRHIENKHKNGDLVASNKLNLRHAIREDREDRDIATSNTR